MPAAMADFREALRLYEGTGKSDARSRALFYTAESLLSLAADEERAGNKPRAEELVERAIPYLEDAEVINPDDPYGQLALLWRLWWEENFEKAIETADEVVEKFGYIHEAHRMRGVLYLTQKFPRSNAPNPYHDPFEAADALTTAVRLYPRDGQIWHELAIAYLLCGDTEGAKDTFGKGLAMNPDHPLMRAYRAQLRFSEGDLPGAEEDCFHLMEVAPENPIGYKTLANFYLQLGAYDMLEEAMRGAVTREEAPAAAWNLLAVALRHQERYEEAIVNMNRCLEKDPSPPGHWFNRGTALRLAHRHEEAISDFRKAVARGDPEARYYKPVQMLHLRGY